MQEKNVRLLKNNEAISGVLLAINAAIDSVSSSSSSTTSSSTSVQFNSSKGLKTQTLINLILGFHAAFVTTIYTPTAHDLAKTILYIFSTKKIMAFSTDDVTELNTQKTFLKDVIQVRITAAISEVQAEITAAGKTVETTEDDIEKFTFPIAAETTTTTTTKLTKVELLLVTLKAMLANLDGLKLSLTAISTALASSSSSGESCTLEMYLNKSLNT